jgi:NAD-dependent dihydropyrimidine dehydrogenase PreA subunit
MKNNLAFIDSYKCKLCRKCEPECPTHCIIETGLPVRKAKAGEQTAEVDLNM